MSIREYQQGVMRHRPWAYWPLDSPSSPITNIRIPGGANTVNAPDSPATSTTGDIEVVIRMTLDNWATNNQIIFSKDNNASRSFQFLNIQGSTGPRLYWWDSGAALHNVDYGTTLASVLTNSVYYWLKFSFDVNDGAGNRVFTVSYAADQDTIPVSWTVLGTPVTTAGVTTTLDGTAIFTLGDATFGAGMVGNVKYMEFHNVVGGSAQAIMDATQATSGLTWTDATTGVVWTLSGASVSSTMRDISGNGRTLTPSGAMTYNGGITRLGTKSINTTGAGASAGSQTINFTEVSVIGWMKWTAVPATGTVVFSAGADNWSLQMWDNGNAYWDMGNNTGGRVFAAWPARWIGTWVHFVCSGSTTRGRQGVWINGETFIDTLSTPVNPNSAFIFGVGQQGADGTQWRFNGQISNLAVVTTELRRADARRLYNLALGRPC